MGDENVNMAQSADNKNIKNDFARKVAAPAKVRIVDFCKRKQFQAGGMYFVK